MEGVSGTQLICKPAMPTKIFKATLLFVLICQGPKSAWNRIASSPRDCFLTPLARALAFFI